MRNDHLFNHSPILPHTIRYKTSISICQQNLSNIFSASGLTRGLPPDVWLPPPGIYIKLDFDGSFSPLSQHAGIGGVICNYTGLLVAAFAVKIQAIHSIEAKLQKSDWITEVPFWKVTASYLLKPFKSVTTCREHL